MRPSLQYKFFLFCGDYFLIMRKLVEGFSLQVEDALKRKDEVKLNIQDFNNVVIAGLGGSGIGASVFQRIALESSPCPLFVIKNYFLPGWADKNTLLIVSSYSGNTEETLHVFEEGIKRNCKIVVITSGGLIGQKAKDANLPVYSIPEGFPPRACLAYSLIYLIDIGIKTGLYNKNKFNSGELLDFIRQAEAEIIPLAASVADKIYDHLPVIYATDDLEPVSVRWRQQLNENAKILCWHHAVPEMNHNELVGWADNHPELSIIFLRNQHDFKRTAKRMDISREIISRKCENITEIWGRGNTETENIFYFILLGDWISVLLAEKRKVDPVEVKIIDYLKNVLAED